MQAEVALFHLEVGLARFPAGAGTAILSGGAVEYEKKPKPGCSTEVDSGSSGFYTPFVPWWKYLGGIWRQSTCLDTVCFNSKKLFPIFFMLNE